LEKEIDHNRIQKTRASIKRRFVEVVRTVSPRPSRHS